MSGSVYHTPVYVPIENNAEDFDLGNTLKEIENDNQQVTIPMAPVRQSTPQNETTITIPKTMNNVTNTNE